MMVAGQADGMDRYGQAGALALIGDAAGAAAVLRHSEALTRPDVHSYSLLLAHFADVVPEALFEEHLRWASDHAPGSVGCAPANDPAPDRRLRIGYVSADFREDHPLTCFIESVLAGHDRDRFFVAGYASVNRPDALTARFAALANIWRDLRGLGDAEAAALIRSDRIDLLVDLGGHCAGNRLLVFARRAAPVQVTWLGYPNTTGLSAMDYRLTDEIADPPGASDRLHSERLIRLPRGFLCYRPPPADVAVSALPAWFAGRVTFGCFQYPGKITDEVIAIWARILWRAPHSELLLHHSFSDYDRPAGAVRNRIAAGFTARGIAPGRLRFLGARGRLREHLHLYGQVDIALDTFPYNGTTTTCESLWMGVPVITLAGRTHAARVGASILSRAGLGELAAGDGNRYVELALALASDLDRLATVRASLRRALENSPLLDAAGFTRSLESAYREMWRHWCEQQRQQVERR